MNRILVVRGGAIGDFILTLPALATLRRAHPRAEIHVLGYQHIAELVNKRGYADRVRSIEYGPLASFFARNSELPSELANYFAGFQLVVSYLYDPDLIFENNLRRCGAQEILRGPSRIEGDRHAALQLAQPLKNLGLHPDDLGARLYPSSDDREAARRFLDALPRPLVAIHPGSGSDKKNWPIEKWAEFGTRLLKAQNFSGSLIVVSGEADDRQVQRLRACWQTARVRFAANLPLPHLAAVLEQTVYFGHDSGISHLAAATGASCTLLFGPTNSDVWAPIGENVQVFRAPNGDLSRIPPEDLMTRLRLE